MNPLRDGRHTGRTTPNSGAIYRHIQARNSFSPRMLTVKCISGTNRTRSCKGLPAHHLCPAGPAIIRQTFFICGEYYLLIWEPSSNPILEK